MSEDLSELYMYVGFWIVRCHGQHIWLREKRRNGIVFTFFFYFTFFSSKTYVHFVMSQVVCFAKATD